MRHFMRHPVRKQDTARHSDKAHVGIATHNITVTDGPFTETKELIGSQTRLKSAPPTSR